MSVSPFSSPPIRRNPFREIVTTRDLLGPPGAPKKRVTWDEYAYEYTPTGGTRIPRTLNPPPGFEHRKKRQTVTYELPAFDGDPSSYDSPPPDRKSVVDVDTPKAVVVPSPPRKQLFKADSPIGGLVDNNLVSPVTFL